jgi:2-polyprenyl-3-methyl-5-hydroxy-6-metoxy-1,4-benzoquinol methylase
MSRVLRCWCGNQEFAQYGPEYLRCRTCASLVSRDQPGDRVLRVQNDGLDFYGKAYWFTHQEQDLHQPNLQDRARSDLSERCLHWLRTVLKYRLPPARVLELGCAHGGFTAMLRSIGFDAAGLELSPSVVDYAQRTFRIPMLTGPLEDQRLEDSSFDVIVLMDVLEHLPDPLRTMRRALDLLSDGGFLLIQTPSVPEDVEYEQLAQRSDRFIEQLKSNEHLFMFTPTALRRFFTSLGAPNVVFEPAMFPWYDMFAVVSRATLLTNGWVRAESALMASPSGRFVLALLDASEKARVMQDRLQESEADRNARLANIEKLTAMLQESEARRASELQAYERDRAQHLETISSLHARLVESEADRANRIEK